MKIKTFLIVFIGALIILVGAAAVTYTQLAQVDEINTGELSDKLYQEDSKILSLAMQTVNPAALESLTLPESWAEILVVENGSLKVIASTNRVHKDQYMYKLPGLLDQSKGIIAAMQGKKAGVVGTPDYMVAIRPLEGETSLIGFKPKTWEMQLIAHQATVNKDKSKEIILGLIIFLAVGVVLALAMALAVALTTGRQAAVFVKALDSLSMGDLEVEPPSGKGSEVATFTAAFQRIKASLSMALERIGA